MSELIERITYQIWDIITDETDAVLSLDEYNQSAVSCIEDDISLIVRSISEYHDMETKRKLEARYGACGHNEDWTNKAWLVIKDPKSDRGVIILESDIANEYSVVAYTSVLSEVWHTGVASPLTNIINGADKDEYRILSYIFTGTLSECVKMTHALD